MHHVGNDTGFAGCLGTYSLADDSVDTVLLKAQARHPQPANFLMLGDLPNSTVTFAGIMLDTGVLPVPIQSDQLDGLQLDRSYAGFSISLAPERIHVRTALPVETFQSFAKIGFFVQGLLAGQN